MSEKRVILVADDDPPTLTLMQALLGRYGFRVLAAAEGAEALEAARRQSPALALIDKNMPGMEAGELIRSLRQLPGLDGLPVLILSGERLRHSEVVALGASGAVEKPFEVPGLIDEIRRRIRS